MFLDQLSIQGLHDVLFIPYANLKSVWFFLIGCKITFINVLSSYIDSYQHKVTNLEVSRSYALVVFGHVCQFYDGAHEGDIYSFHF